ncbi:putative reverse transcriptase domain-containing protein [Tanacetum coccineum]
MITNNNRTRGRTLAGHMLQGLCAPKCHKWCNRVVYLARDCRSTANANTANNQRGTGAGQKATCFECEAQGHFKRECPKMRNNNRANQGGNGNALAKVYAVCRAEINPDSNIVMGSSGLVCQDEGWIISNVHRLLRTEQANGEESLSTPKD